MYVEEGICLHVVHTLCESNAGRRVGLEIVTIISRSSGSPQPHVCFGIGVKMTKTGSSQSCPETRKEAKSTNSNTGYSI